MTDSQKRIYTYVLKYNKTHGEVPSTPVAGKHFGISQQAIHEHYKRFIKMGLLEKRARQAEFAIPTLATQSA
jgi:predicted transcriptional regulator